MHGSATPVCLRFLGLHPWFGRGFAVAAWKNGRGGKDSWSSVLTMLALRTWGGSARETRAPLSRVIVPSGSNCIRGDEGSETRSGDRQTARTSHNTLCHHHAEWHSQLVMAVGACGRPIAEWAYLYCSYVSAPANIFEPAIPHHRQCAAFRNR